MAIIQKIGNLLKKNYNFFTLLDQPLPIKTSRKLKGLVDSVNPHLEQIELNQNQLIEKFGEETDQGFEILPENREKFIEALEKYLQYEIIISWTPTTRRLQSFTIVSQHSSEKLRMRSCG